MRESLFERLKKRKLSYIQELCKIYRLLYNSNSNTYSYYSNGFKKSPFNKYYENIDDALCDIVSINCGCIQKRRDFKCLLNDVLSIGADLTLDSFLDYLELFRTLSEYIGVDFDVNANQLTSIVLSDCDRLGYEFIFEADENRFKVMLKNSEAESVALQQKESIRDKIYKYLMIRNGRINDKRECIKSLADDIEVICKKYSNIQEYSKLKQFIQCVRHTKDRPIKEFSFYYENEEKWLDKTFEMIIGVLSFTKTKEIVSEIINHENNFLTR